MDLQTVREKWLNYNCELIDRFAKETGANSDTIEKIKVFGIDYLIDFESELEEDPENEDGGILTIDTVTAGYIDSFLGRWYIQKVESVTEDDLQKMQNALNSFFTYLKENKLYKERAARFTQMTGRLENKKKYIKRLKEYQKIQQENDQEKKLDLLQEWEFEDLV